MEYKSVTTLDEIKAYVNGAPIVSFDFETAPDDAYRSEDKAALDAHKSHIAGVSFSVKEGSGIYVPFAHLAGENAVRQDDIWGWLAVELFQNMTVIKVAHNLNFEAMFLYAKDIVIQSPVYDTIAASQMTLKSSTVFRKLGDSGLKTLEAVFNNVSAMYANEK